MRKDSARHIHLKEVRPLKKPVISEKAQAELNFCSAYEKFVELMKLSGIEEHMLSYLIDKAMEFERSKK